MGKGDKKTRRGKIIMGSYGVKRTKKKRLFVHTEKEKPLAKIEKEATKKEKTPNPPAAKKTTKKPTAKKAAGTIEKKGIAEAEN